MAKRKRIASYGRRGALVRVFDETAAGNRLVRVQWTEAKGAPLSTQSWPYSKANVETARAFAQGVDQRLAAGGAAPVADRSIRELSDLHIAAFAESWAPKTLQNFKHRWSRFEAFVGRNTSARLVTEETLDEFRAKMRLAKVATTQRSETVKAVKQVFRWARRRKLLSENPIADYVIKLAKTEKPGEVPEWSPEDTTRLGGQLLRERASRSSRHWRLEVAFFLASAQGPRQNAMRHLAFDDVNLSGDTVRHPTAKDVVLPPRSVWWNPAFDKLGKERVQPLTRGAVRALRLARVWRQRMKYEGKWVLAPVAARVAERGDPVTYQALNQALRELCNRCDPIVPWITGRAFHGFRKFAAGEVHRLTNSERAAADWIGDADIKIVRRHYLAKRSQEQRGVAEMINRDDEATTSVKGEMREKRLTDAAHFWERVGTGDGCWEWTGPRLPKGYGYFYDKSVQPGIIYSHRFAFEQAGGTLPEGMHVCHSCDNPPCCRPDHLFAGTALVNLSDMREKGREGDTMPKQNARKTHCKHGHEFTPENTRTYQGRRGPARGCIACDDARDKHEAARVRRAGGIGSRPERAKPITHGTRTGYNRGCRCEACGTANAKHQRTYRALTGSP